MRFHLPKSGSWEAGPISDEIIPYQLIEGHSRLGYLLAMCRTGIFLKKKQKVFLLSQHATPIQPIFQYGPGLRLSICGVLTVVFAQDLSVLPLVQ